MNDQGVCYMDGSLFPLSEARLPLLDLGLLRGYGIFDYLRAYRRSPFHLREHLERFAYSAREIGLKLPLSLSEMEQLITDLLNKMNFADANIKLILTGGVSEDQFLPTNRSFLALLVYPFRPYPSSYYEEGIHLVSTKLARSLPHVKTLHYTPGIVSILRGRSQGVHDALHLNEKEEILEATTSNFFAIRGERLLTPRCDGQILQGITREIVLKLAKDILTVEEGVLPYSDSTFWDEAFITSSSRELLPVVCLDGHFIGEGRVGKKTRELMELFKDYVEKRIVKEGLSQEYKIKSSFCK